MIKDFITYAIYTISAFLFLVFFILIIWGIFAATSVYSVWSSGKAGEAQLAKANYNRQIAIREADAKYSASIELAKAEVVRASGIAKANRIIGQSLNKNEAYLSYLWIETLNNKANKVIYVPTEANMPINEAGRGVK